MEVKIKLQKRISLYLCALIITIISFQSVYAQKKNQYNGNTRFKYYGYGKKFHKNKSIYYMMEVETSKNSFNYHWETFF